MSQDRVRRLARLAHHETTPFGRLPQDWDRILPRAAPLRTPERWSQALAIGQAGTEVTDILLPVIDLLDGGTDRAAEAGETLLRGSARLLWRRALTRASQPRHWKPRWAAGQQRGPIAAQPHHRSTSRRDATGRLLGLSPLLPHMTEPERLRRVRVPARAMSEQDRMMARPGKFAGTVRARSANGCWQDWNNPAPTAHDGLMRAGHPALIRALGRTHSASSLRMLLRNPLAFTWQYALGWKEPDSVGESIDLDAMQFGSLVHDVLEAALPAIEDAGGIGRAVHDAIAAAAVAQARGRDRAAQGLD